MNEDSSPLARVSPQSWLLRQWGAFNYWRKRYWRTRLIVLCLIFAPAIIPRLAHRSVIVDLVRTACDALLACSEPALVTFLARHHRLEEARGLQVLLMQRMDANDDGWLDSGERDRASAIGLDPGQLTGKPRHADLQQLVGAARSLGLVRGLCSAKVIRRKAFHTAIGEAQVTLAPERRRIDALIESCYDWPDYRTWPTWRRGMRYFWLNFVGTAYGVGELKTVLAWLIACLLVSLCISASCRTRQRLVGVGVALALTAVAISLLRGSAPGTPWGGDDTFAFWCASFGLLCLSAAVGALGAGFAQRARCPLLTSSVGVSLLGMTLISWSRLPPLKSGWFWMNEALVGRQIPTALKGPMAIIGGGLVVVGVLLGYAVARGHMKPPSPET